LVEGVEVDTGTMNVFTVVAFVTTTLEANSALLPLTVVLALNTVFAGTDPKKDFTVIFLDTGVPCTSSIINNRSDAVGAVIDVNCVIFLSAIIQLPILY
jgi:hypothetical protein